MFAEAHGYIMSNNGFNSILVPVEQLCDLIRKFHCEWVVGDNRFYKE